MTEEKDYEKYEAFVRERMNGYLLNAKIIAFLIDYLQKRNIISQEVFAEGRIKSYSSMKKNYGKKAVDDCFGFRIVASEQDLLQIRRAINVCFFTEKIKKHEKEQGRNYEAFHQIGYMKIDTIKEKNQLEIEENPIIEIQYWNEETHQKCVTGELAYEKYKNSSRAEIRRIYEQGEYDILKDIPIGIRIENGTIQVLTAKEKLEEMYPFLIEEKKQEVVEGEEK